MFKRCIAAKKSIKLNVNVSMPVLKLLKNATFWFEIKKIMKNVGWRGVFPVGFLTKILKFPFYKHFLKNFSVVSLHHGIWLSNGVGPIKIVLSEVGVIIILKMLVGYTGNTPLVGYFR